MDAVFEKIKSVIESDEEDYENFFLQPTTSPYNITEKVQKANLALSEEQIDCEDRQIKVKFKENLVDFEPSSTDDDVNSLESDVENGEYLEEHNENISTPQVLEYKLQDEVMATDVTANECADEEINEEIIEEDVETSYHDDKNEETKLGQDKEIETKISDVKHPLESDVKTKSEINKSRKAKRKKTSETVKFIECKNHCIERLDFELNLSINKLNLKEKQLNFPPLKLQRRKCCEEIKQNSQQHLPSYSGFRSEYGLSCLQLERREKRREILMLKEERRQKLLQEYKERKIQQNEEVFNKWLKEIERRKQCVDENKGKKNNVKQCLTPKIYRVPNDNLESSRDRPKTANTFVPSLKMKCTKRPHTSPARVYVEIPSSVLRRGINVGDILVTNKNSGYLKNLHILTFS